MSNVTELKPLLTLCSLLALVPPYSFDKKAIVVTKRYKCYAVLLSLVMVFGYCYSLYGKLIKDMFHDYLETLKVIEHLTNAFLNLTNISAIILSVFYNSEKLQNIITGLDTFDHTTRTNSGIGKKKVLLMLVIFHLIVVGFLVVDTMQWLSFVHFQMVKYYMPRNVFTYNFCMVVNLKIFLVIEIERRFKTLNQILTAAARDGVDNFEKKENVLIFVSDCVKKDLCERHSGLKGIGKLHNFLCQMVDNFNDTYGFIILATVIFTIIIIVNYTGLVMAFTVFRIQLDVSTDNINLLYVSFFWILGTMLQVLVLATRCHSLTTEVDRTAEICYSFLSTIPGSPGSEKICNLKEELTLIAQQTLQRRPRISAAGFFEVNHDMCGFILSTVTSYIIVTIQFLAKERHRY